MKNAYFHRNGNFYKNVHFMKCMLNKSNSEYMVILAMVISIPTLPLIAQPPGWDCATGIQGAPRIQNCSEASADWMNIYRHKETWIPDSVATPIKTLHVNINIWQRSDGTGNMYDTPTNRTRFEQIEIWLNDKYQYNSASTWPMSYSVPYIDDSRIRVVLDSVYFYQDPSSDSSYYESNSYGHNQLLDSYLEANHPERTRALNLHLVKKGIWWDTINGGAWASVGGYSDYGSIESFYRTIPDMNDNDVHDYWYAAHLAHEIGHSFDLWHTYDHGYSQTCSFSQSSYLWDVFDTTSSCPPCNSCLIPNHALNNNHMGGGDNFHKSVLQMAISQRSIALNNFHNGNYGVRDHVTGYSEVPWEVSEDETWDFSMKLYQDLVIKTGATLTVQCELQFVPQAGIVVEPGARLIMDGGKLTSEWYHQGFWRGIQVHGTTNQHQFPADHPTYQGIVILKNDAVIEHAREAIQLWKPNDWNSIGGVVQVQGTSPTQLGGTFLNCRRAVTFMSYQNFHPSVPAIKRTNNSYFHYAHFEVDDDYRGGDDFYTHVSMLAVDGVQYRACIFKNSQTQVPQSSKIGYGIFSIDANYTVQGHCNISLPVGTPCPEQNLNRGKFIGLGQGIHALDGSTGRGFTADLLRFENNVVGVYTGDLPVFSVTRNQFVLGDRNVSMDRPEELDFQELYHRAISTQQSHGFRIEENTITAAPNIAAQGIVGIVIENTGSNSTHVYLNSASDLDLGYVGEGHCIDVNSAFAVGHQFLCNANSNNVQNVTVREDGTGGSDHGIRVFQGSDISPAMNTFDQEVGVLDESDFKNSTQWPVGYWHKGGQSEPLDVTSGWVVTLSASGTNNCPSLFESGPMKMGQAMVGQRTSEMLAAKEAWLNTSYVYASLIDGGNTPATVQQVQQSWPQDAWELRAQLMATSPYLSTEVLMEMMKKNTLPQAMVLEICLANPEATKKEGFLKWSEQEAPSPLPAYMADLIAGSWAEKTFRMELEAQMGQHHVDMTLAADLLQVSFNADTMGIPVDSMLAVWQELPSYGARYGELRMHLRSGQFTDARNVLNSLSANYPMREGREQERDRALWFIDRLESFHGEGRTMMQLDSGEVAQLRAFALAGADIPAGWARNILCFGYSICLPPPGGTGGDNKTLNPVSPELSQSAAPLLRLMPNPAAVAVSIVIEVPGGLRDGHVRILDMSGREVARLPVAASPQQLVWDTRQQATGAYHVELFGNGERLATERLIIQAR